MKITSLTINRKGFKDIKICFNNNLNLLYGKNGSGKSLILKVLANAVNRDFTKFSYLSFSEIEVITSEEKIKIVRGNDDPYVNGYYDDDIISTTSVFINDELVETFDYYDKSEVEIVDDLVYLPMNKQCTNFAPCTFSVSSLLYGRKKLSNSQQSAIKFAIKDYNQLTNSSLSLERLDGEFEVVNNDASDSNRILPGFFSSGQLNALNILYSSSILNSSKVLLIDDIETCLHIDLQRSLISKLRENQSNQMIVSTNSPVILSSVRSEGRIYV